MTAATASRSPVVLEAALSYAHRGWRIVPVNGIASDGGCTCGKRHCDDIGKHPWLPDWSNKATANETVICGWLRQRPLSNIGVLTGRSSGVFVLDKDGEIGARSLDALQMEHGLLPPTLTVTTGGGNQHFYFAYPEDMTVPTNAGEIAPGIDLRGEGGQAVLPPSLHRSGRPYVWDDELDDITPAPPWLLEKIAQLKRMGARTITTGGAGDDGAPIPEGRRNDALAASAGRMRWAGLTADEIVDALQRVNRERCQPPLAEDEVEAIAQSIGRYPAGDGAEGTTPGRNGTSAHADAGKSTSPRLSLDDFVAHLEAHKYLYRPTGKLWPRVSVNAAVSPVLTGRIDEKGNPVWQPASDWLDEHQPVHQVTWSPGDPEIIEARLLNQGGWIERSDFRAYNLYRPPTIPLGDPEQAGRWVDHVRQLYPEHAEHIIHWFAHRVQRPAEKINHALLLGGQQGCGKDTILRPVREAIGPWNYADASPAQVVGRFNGFLKSVILLVPELCDLGDLNRYAFYEHMKPIIAAPPATLRCDEKFLAEIAVLNVCGVVFTSNQRIGIYLPAGDRRHFAVWSELEPAKDLPTGYFESFHRWLDDEHGSEHVAAYLRTFDLTGFNPNAPPPKTEWFWNIVESGRAPEESELSTLLDSMGDCPGEEEWPDAVTLAQLIAAERRRSGWNPDDKSGNTFASWLEDRKNRRQIPHRMEAVGYVAVRSNTAKDGLWIVGGVRMAIYARRQLSFKEQITAASRLASGEGPNQ